MESNVVKGGIAFAAVMIVGFIIVGTTKESPEEKMQGAMLQTSGLLNSLALKKCTEAVKKQVNAHPYTPSESESDGTSYVHLVWSKVGSGQRAECRYVTDEGIQLLKIDDQVIIDQAAAAK